MRAYCRTGRVLQVRSKNKSGKKYPVLPKPRLVISLKAHVDEASAKFQRSLMREVPQTYELSVLSNSTRDSEDNSSNGTDKQQALLIQRQK